ncbi:molybdopterin-dependent oxidoreductase [soil metagenome]
MIAPGLVRLARRTSARIQGSFSSPLHDERIAAALGIALGVSFSVCFATGLFSNLLQDNPSWAFWPSRPAGLYRVTQGVHVTTGLASIPLLLAKLWVVYPKLFAWPAFSSLAHLVERLTLLVLVGGGLFLVFTGLGNINIYRPWSFGFRPGHYWAAWTTIGAMIVHIGAKAGTTRLVLRGTGEPLGAPDAERTNTGGLGRRGFLGTVFGASGAVALFTVGQTFAPLRKLALLAPRRPDVGPQGFPINRTAASAGVTETAFDPGYRLTVEGPGGPLRLSLADLRDRPQHEATLPIACVEGWSAEARWRGVRVRDLLAEVGAPDDAGARVVSFQRGRRLGSSDLHANAAHDPDTLLALEVNGEPLHVEHGYPLRLIGPNRPGVLQTKWVDRLEAR